jgi:hypothetical protein
MARPTSSWLGGLKRSDHLEILIILIVYIKTDLKEYCMMEWNQPSQLGTSGGLLRIT